MIKNKIPRILTLSFLVFYTVAAISVSLHRFWQYETFYFDFGIYDQALWNLSQGKLPLTYHPRFNFGILFNDHLEITYLGLAPLYQITNRPELLLIIQGLVVGLSGYIAYLIAKKRGLSEWQAGGLTFAYLMFVGLQNAIISDFHPTTLSPLFLLSLIYLFISKKWKLYGSVLILSLALREDMGIIIAGMGFWLWCSFSGRKQKIMSLVTILVSVGWVITAVKFIIPMISGAQYAYQANMPISMSEGWRQMFFPVDLKFRTIWVSIANFAGLPLLTPALWPTLMAHYATRFVFNSAATRFDLGLHYNAPVAVVYFLGSLGGLNFMIKKRWKAGLVAATILLLAIPVYFHKFYLHGPLGLAYNRVFYKNTQRQAYMDNFVNEIPKNKGLIMTQNNIAPRMIHFQPTMLLVKEYNVFLPKVVAIDLREGQNANNFFPLNQLGTEFLVEKLEMDKRYTKKEFPERRYIFVLNNE